jgi:hypothetical protein
VSDGEDFGDTCGACCVRYFAPMRVLRLDSILVLTLLLHSCASRVSISTAMYSTLAATAASSYAPSLDCVVTVWPAGGLGVVLMNVTMMDIQQYDGVSIFDGPSINSPLLLSTNGNTTLPTVAATKGRSPPPSVSPPSVLPSCVQTVLW